MWKRPILLFVLMLPAFVILDLLKGAGPQFSFNFMSVLLFVVLYEFVHWLIKVSKPSNKNGST